MQSILDATELGHAAVPTDLLATENPSRVQHRVRRRRSTSPKVRIDSTEFVLDWHEAMVEFRRRYLLAALERFDWNIKRTARALGVVRRTLQIQMRQMGLKGNAPGGAQE